MLYDIFSYAHARLALSRKIAFSVAGNVLRSLHIQLLKSSSVNTHSPGASLVPWSLHLAVAQVRWMWWHCQKLAYPLGLRAFALNSGASHSLGSCWSPQEGHREIFKWLVLFVWACLLEAFADHSGYSLTGHALLIYEEYGNIAECVMHAFQPLTTHWQTFARANWQIEETA